MRYAQQKVLHSFRLKRICQQNVKMLEVSVLPFHNTG